MGALFTSDPSVLKPVLADIGSRGLFYLDDGSSARSRVKEAAGGTPILRADVILDADNDPAALDQRLNQLSAIADERGYAIGFASAFPTSIDHITAFIRKARQQGVTFVPLSSLVQSGRT
jgi:hypothetical protein